MSEYKKQWLRFNETLRKAEKCWDNKEFIKFITGEDWYDYFVKKHFTKEDFKTNWRSHQMRQIIAKAKIHLDKKGGA